MANSFLYKSTAAGLCFIFALGVAGLLRADEAWQEIKDKHFVVYYHSEDLAAAQTTLREAERYYKKVGDRIGYSRYRDFWTWDERVKIILFSDQNEFMRRTGQPVWSSAYVDRDRYLFQSRSIVTYKQENDFYTGILPHEISHLILKDFMGAVPIAMWFEEGVAQLEEAPKSGPANAIMRKMVRKNTFIPLRELMRMDVRLEKEKSKVVVFYAESLTIIEFLIKNYGGNAFSRLCQNLRDGKSFDEALRLSYTNTIDSLDELQEKWVKYFLSN